MDSGPVERSPRFAIVRRGYQCNQVDSYLAPLIRRLEEAEAARDAARSEAGALEEAVAQARARLDDHEPRPPATPFSELGEEIGRVLQAAAQAADDIRQRSQEGAAAALARAQEAGAETVKAAQARALELEQAAQADRAQAKEVFDKARQDAADMASELRSRAEAQAATVIGAAESQATSILARAEREGEGRIVKATAEAERLVAGAEETRRATLSELATAKAELASEIAQLEERQASVVAELDRLRDLLGEATAELADAHARRTAAAEPAPAELAPPAGSPAEEELPADPVMAAEAELPATAAPASEEEQPPAAAPAAAAASPPEPSAPEEPRLERATHSAPSAGHEITLDPDQEEEFRRLFGALAQPEPDPAAEAASVSPPPFPAEARDRAIEGLARKLKRALQDEQNLVLDAIRQAGDATDPAAVLPPLDDTISRLSAAVGPLLGQVLEAVGQPDSSEAARILSEQVGAPLHQEAEAVLEQSAAGGEGGAMTSDRVSAVFRAWRTTRSNDLAEALFEQAVTGMAPTGAPT